MNMFDDVDGNVSMHTHKALGQVIVDKLILKKNAKGQSLVLQPLSPG